MIDLLKPDDKRGRMFEFAKTNERRGTSFDDFAKPKVFNPELMGFVGLV